MVDYDVAEVVGVSANPKFEKFNEALSTLQDPAYREKYNERFAEYVVKRGMDMVQHADGSISTIESTIRVNSYEWNERKHDFERLKNTRKSISSKGEIIES